jgi:hypothetical protein
VAAQLDAVAASRKRREFEQLMRSAPVYAYLVPVKDDDGDADVDPGVPRHVVSQFNRFAVKARFSRFTIHARAVGQRVRRRTRPREHRARPVRRGGNVATRAGPLPPSDDPELARTARGAP